MFDRKIYSDIHVVLNGQIISGIQSIEGGFLTNSEHLKDIGNTGYTGNYIGEFVSENTVAQFSFTRCIIGPDPINFLNLTGDEQITGYVYYNNGPFKPIGFTTGYLINYRVDGAVGGFLTNTCRINIYGDLGGIISGDNMPFAENIPDKSLFRVIYPKDISFLGIHAGPTGETNTEDKYIAVTGTNRVLGFSYELDIPRDVLYSMESRSPILVKRKTPITITTSINLDIDEYELKNMMDTLCPAAATGQVDSFRIILGNYCTNGGEPFDYLLTFASQYGENFKASINEDLSTTVTFRSYIVI